MKEHEDRPNMDASAQFCSIQLVEILGISAGRTNEQPIVLITLRPSPEVWHSVNIAVTKEQGQRLQHDLEALLESSTFLKH